MQTKSYLFILIYLITFGSLAKADEPEQQRGMQRQDASLELSLQASHAAKAKRYFDKGERLFQLYEDFPDLEHHEQYLHDSLDQYRNAAAFNHAKASRKYALIQKGYLRNLEEYIVYLVAAAKFGCLESKLDLVIYYTEGRLNDLHLAANTFEAKKLLDSIFRSDDEQIKCKAYRKIQEKLQLYKENGMTTIGIRYQNLAHQIANQNSYSECHS